MGRDWYDRFFFFFPFSVFFFLTNGLGIPIAKANTGEEGWEKKRNRGEKNPPMVCICSVSYTLYNRLTIPGFLLLHYFLTVKSIFILFLLAPPTLHRRVGSISLS